MSTNKELYRQKGEPKMRQKKDMIFIIVLGLALVNLIYFFAGAVSAAVVTKHWWAAIWIFVDGIAIIGILYLLRSYKRARKETKRIEREEEKRVKLDR